MISSFQKIEGGPLVCLNLFLLYLCFSTKKKRVSKTDLCLCGVYGLPEAPPQKKESHLQTFGKVLNLSPVSFYVEHINSLICITTNRLYVFWFLFNRLWTIFYSEKCQVFVLLNLLFPWQLSANHRMDHRCWHQLWPMRELKLTTGVIMTSWNASCVLQSKAVLLFLSVSAVDVQPFCSPKLPVGFEIDLQWCFCSQEWLLTPGIALFEHISFNMASNVCMYYTILQSWLHHQNSSAT